MCDPISLALMAAGTAASVIGGGMTAKEAAKNDLREMEARNRVLAETTAKNKLKADASREAFSKRVTESEAAPAQQNLANAQTQQVQSIEGNMVAPTSELPISGDAPAVVKSSLGTAMQDSFAKSKAQAQALGKLGGYGAMARDDAIADGGLGLEVNTNNDAVRGNMSIMPSLQDYASYRARKPSSGLGQIIQAAGGAMSKYAGSR